MWFLVGALVGGIGLGAALLAVRAAGQALPAQVTIGFGVVCAGLIFGSALLGLRPPSLHRQVDHRWLDRYRGWVIGAGFGFQLGAGFFTLISSFALYLLVLSAFVGAPPASLLSAGLAYGGLRGLFAAPGGWITRPPDLRRALATIVRLERYARPAARGVDLVASVSLVGILLTELV